METVDVMNFKRIWVVYNHKSGKQLFTNMLSRVNEIYKQLRRHVPGGDFRLVDVKKFTDLPQIARDVVSQGVDWVVIAGGDGTIRGLIEKIVNCGYCPYFSIFPAGTVNLMARELLVSKEPAKWMKRIAKGLVTPVYYGMANESLFLTVAGIGYDSLIVDAVTETSKKILSKFAYVWQGAEMIRREMIRKNWRYEFTVRLDDDEKVYNASTVFACKSRYYAGRYMLFDDASLSDDYFHVVLFTGKSSTDFVRYSALMGLEALGLDKSIVRLKAKKIEITCNVDDFPVELDGDVVTVSPLKIEMNSDPLKFIS